MAESTAAPRRWYRRLSLTTWIFIALVLGILAGLGLQGAPEVAETYVKPLGTIFLNLIKMIVVPLVLFSIIAGVVSLQDVRKVGAIGGKTILLYLATTACAVTLGLVFANVMNVGAGYSLDSGELAYEAQAAPSLIDTIVGIFPSNFFQPMADATMLQVIVIAVVFGFGIIAAGPKARVVVDFVEAMSEVCIQIMRGILLVAPIGVFGLIAPVIAANGPDVLLPLAWLVAVAYVAMACQITVVYSALVKALARRSPLGFLRGELPVIGFAFASASSVGSLPLNMECAEKMGVSKEVYSFVLPLGATINMDGTAIYQGVCAIFIAQVFGVELTLGQQLTVVLTSVLASIGTAGVPGSGMIMLAMVLQSVGLPVEGVALVAGVDRILDMARTTVNVTGDAAVAQCVDALQRRAAARRARRAA
ncbi:dicarboxylate/amino acid:cation symporter [Adlercreutzia faecimuris]|uniref:Dicarboxylate/amino acid:cation symporter n=1 Tax=Adlercreutzia faecimuris TaxID=2897341 RepID=A0ABS9WGN5_9ACTN|nr:dicarboxylate/amino acid:cation symporter [Adlercreutzia sp. JBNU-10]MCI2242021.1 dicarboxylate/amino acid:cation symporter [Adlercreutzia sp. JBNU-10]